VPDPQKFGDLLTFDNTDGAHNNRPDRASRLVKGACTPAPLEHWRKIWSTNPLERVNVEIKRRANIIGIFPNEGGILRVAGSVLIDGHDEWAIAERRYLSEESMAKIAAMDNHRGQKEVRGKKTKALLASRAASTDVEVSQVPSFPTRMVRILDRPADQEGLRDTSPRPAVRTHHPCDSLRTIHSMSGTSAALSIIKPRRADLLRRSEVLPASQLEPMKRHHVVFTVSNDPI
jgi:hypothetical protein